MFNSIEVLWIGKMYWLQKLHIWVNCLQPLKTITFHWLWFRLIFAKTSFFKRDHLWIKLLEETNPFFVHIIPISHGWQKQHTPTKNVENLEILKWTVVPLALTKLKGGYTGFTSTVRLSIRLSIHLRTESCLLCNFHNIKWIHFMFTYLIKHLQKVCRMLSWLQHFKIWIFGNFFQICNFNFVLFWLGIWNESIVRVMMGWRGIFSKCRHSSCSSFIVSVLLLFITSHINFETLLMCIHTEFLVL